MKNLLIISFFSSALMLSCAKPNNAKIENKFSNISLVPIASGVIPEPLEIEYFLNRRTQLFSQIENNSVVVIPGHKAVKSSNDQTFPFRQNSNFYYLTGFNEPDSVAVLIKNETETQFILFVRPNDPLQEQWRGRRAGLEGAKLLYLADESYDIKDLNTQILEILENKSKLYYDLGSNNDYDTLAIEWLNYANNPKKRINSKPLEIVGVGHMLAEMRVIKDDYEKYLIEKASKISASAHKKAMQAAHTAQYEYELEAEIRYETTRFGAQKQAYSPIVCAGRNATILHYNENDAPIGHNDLILIDAAGEYMNYATDITRTFPASGVFSQTQREIYELVLKAQRAAIEQVKPGNTYDQMENMTRQVLTQGLVDLGLIQANGKTIQQLVAAEAYKPFYMHSCCHWIGLDVHDVSSYKINGQSRTLKPGMIFTVEPGIYINDLIKGIDPKWINIGVRIEDTVLVTENGYKILTADAPKDIDEIEKVMSGF